MKKNDIVKTSAGVFRILSFDGERQIRGIKKSKCQCLCELIGFRIIEKADRKRMANKAKDIFAYTDTLGLYQ